MHTPLEYQRAWDAGVVQVQEAFSRLLPGDVASLRRLAAALMERKGAMHALVERVDSAGHCAVCRGACCVAGRYHFRNADLLVYLVTGEPLFEPLFSNGLCPYLAGDRCLMAPPFRPFNCITFNCETIEDLLPEGDLLSFYRLEGEVRGLYAEIELLFADRALRRALLDLPEIAAAHPAPGSTLLMQCNE